MINSLNDTINLRSHAIFNTRISNELSWVPVNTLGFPRYSIEKLFEITSDKSAKQLQDMQFNLYEAIELFQMCFRFRETNDIVIYNDGIYNWQLHKSGRYAIETNNGCCSSAATWLNYIIKKTYSNRGYIHIIRPDGSGHIINYIKYNEYYYIIDMTTQIYSNAIYTPIETGRIEDYRLSKFYTGVCYKTSDIIHYVNYHSRIQKIYGYNFSYFLLSSYDAIPPTYSIVKNNTCYFYTMNEYIPLKFNNVIYTICDNIYLPRKYYKYTKNY